MSSDAHATPQAEHPHVNYMTIFWMLLALTITEVGLVYAGLPRLVFVLSMIAFALAKAALVAFYFMHLKFEKKTLILVAAAPMIFASVLAVGIVPDGTQEFEKKTEATGTSAEPPASH